MKICASIETEMLGQTIINEFNQKQAEKSAAPAADVHLYVLRLRSPPGEPPRYYVGSAIDYEERLRAHYSGNGAAYTKRYQPVELIELRRGDRYDEDSMTRRLMAEHGIEYVRGGAYSRVQLTPEDITAVTHEIRAAAGLCVNCGKARHFAATCMLPMARASTGAHAASTGSHAATQLTETIIKCERCGRNGHSAVECRTMAQNINCKKCFKRGHRTDECRTPTEETTKFIYTCFRCGYRGHTSNVCVARFDLDGEPITTYNKYYPKTGYTPAAGTARTNWRKLNSASAPESDPESDPESAPESDPE